MCVKIKFDVRSQHCLIRFLSQTSLPKKKVTWTKPKLGESLATPDFICMWISCILLSAISRTLTCTFYTLPLRSQEPLIRCFLPNKFAKKVTWFMPKLGENVVTTSQTSCTYPFKQHLKTTLSTIFSCYMNNIFFSAISYSSFL